MFKKIKNLCLSIGIVSLVAAPGLVSATVFAADNTFNNQIACGTNGTIDTTDSTACNAGTGDTQQSSLNNILKLVINLFSAIVGLIAVIMIIYAGVKYITSGGDSGNISGAKNTIVYAIIGLVIVALAQVIVHFVLGKVSNIGANNSSPTP